jgi:hypothetical protein
VEVWALLVQGCFPPGLLLEPQAVPLVPLQEEKT